MLKILFLRPFSTPNPKPLIGRISDINVGTVLPKKVLTSIKQERRKCDLPSVRTVSKQFIRSTEFDENLSR